MYNIEFLYPYSWSVCFLWLCVCSDLLPTFFHWLVCLFIEGEVLRVLYICRVVFLKHLLPVCGFSSHLSFSWQSLCRTEGLIIRKSSLSVIYFMDCAFGGVCRVTAKPPRSSRSSPMFSSFIDLHFTFRHMTPKKLIFKESIKFGYKLIILHVYIQLLHQRCWRDCLFLLLCHCSFVKDRLTIFVWIYISALYSVLLVYLSIVWPIWHCLDYFSFIVNLDCIASVLWLCFSP